MRTNAYTCLPAVCAHNIIKFNMSRVFVLVLLLVPRWPTPVSRLARIEIASAENLQITPPQPSTSTRCDCISNEITCARVRAAKRSQSAANIADLSCSILRSSITENRVPCTQSLRHSDAGHEDETKCCATSAFPAIVEQSRTAAS